MSGQSRSRSSDLDSQNAVQVVPPQPAVANRAANAGNAAMQDRMRDSKEAPAAGGEQGGGGVATAAPPGGSAPLPPPANINKGTPKAVLDQILYAPSGKGRYKIVGGKPVAVEPGNVTPEQYTAAKQAIEDKAGANDVQNTVKDSRDDRNWELTSPTDGGKGASYTWGDQVTGRTSNGKGNSVTLDYTRTDGSTKQIQGNKGESVQDVRARLDANLQNNTKGMAQGWVNDKTQAQKVIIEGSRTAESGRVVITYTDIDGKTKYYAGKAGETEADVVDRFTSARASVGIPVDASVSVKKTPLWQGMSKKVEAAQKTLFQAETPQARASLARVETNDRNKLLGGELTTTGTAELGTAEAKAGSKVTTGGGKLHAEVNAEAALKLVAFERTYSWEPPARDILGEAVSGRVYVYVKGFIGAEAAAKIEANAQASLKKPQLDPAALLAGSGMDIDQTGVAKLGQAAKDRVGADVTAKAQAFAGAKLNVGVGAEGYWHKKDQNAYQKRLKENATTIIDMLSLGNPGLGWILRQLGAETAAQKILELMFSWGAAGKTSLLAMEAGAQGSAGVGAGVEAQMKFAGGQLRLKFAANATWGLGLGGHVSVVFDALEGVKFAMVVMGELKNVVQDWISQHISDIIKKAGGLLDSVMDWFSADDKVREAVKNRAHEVVGAAERGQLCDTLYSGWFSDDDEVAVMTILRFSKSKGQLSATLAAGPSGLVGSLSRRNRAELGV